eukprot:TRINITY_DN11682_c0_g1_i1.p1 TRINITY_DN11682_c0_g1~~TRINITY_DN11682_c0_g1_i1.p1  ORF type:complete len:538 (-),score=138.78 TRINITY_DN11682_c0_g1_i1:224-1837(-)
MVRLGAEKHESDSESSSSDIERFLARDPRKRAAKSEPVILDVSESEGPPKHATDLQVRSSLTSSPGGSDAVSPNHVIIDLSRTAAFEVAASSASIDSNDDSDIEKGSPLSADRRAPSLPAGVLSPRSPGLHSPATLLDLPDETLVCIMTWLDVPSIGRVAQACKRFNTLSKDLSMWKELSTKKNFFERSGLMEELSPSYFIAKFKKWRDNEREAERLEAERQRAQAAQDSIDRCERVLLLTVFGRPYEWIAAAVLIVVTILSVLKLDHKVDYEWWAILMPLLIIIVHLMFVPFVFDCAVSRYRHTFDDDMGPAKFRWMSPVFYFIAFIVPLDHPSNYKRRSWVLGSTVLCGAFFVLWYVRVGFETSLPWWGVFLPLLAECVLVSLLLILETLTRSKKLDWLVLQSVPVCLFIFFLLVALKLDGNLPDGCNWYCVLVPLVAVKGLLMISAIVMFSLAYCGPYWFRRMTRLGRPGPFWLALAVFAFLFGPLLVFEVLLAKHSIEHSAMTYAAIFAPIFIFLGCGTIGCVILNVVASRTE